MSGFLELDWHDWLDDYKPIAKFPDQVDLVDWQQEDYALETYGLELECVRFMFAFFPDHVWTYCDDGEEGFVCDGYHFVNRLNYFITEVPRLPNVSYEVI